MVTRLPDSDKEYLLSLTPEDITFDLLIDLFGTRSTKENGKLKIHKARMQTYAEFDLAPNEYINKSKVTTTAGRFIFNKYIIEPKLSDILGYTNDVMSGDGMKKLTNVLGNALLNDKIDTLTMADFLNRIQWLSMQFHTVICGSFTMNTLKPHPKVVATRDRLFKENKTALENGDAIKGAQIEKELIEVAKKELAGDHGMDLYKSGARGSFGNNYKNTSIMRGPTINPGTGKFDVSKSSYMEGIRKEELHIFGNSIVSGALTT